MSVAACNPRRRTRPRRQRCCPLSPIHRRRRAVLLLALSAAWMVFTATRAPAVTAGNVEAVATLPQVVSNITGWVVGILAGVATMFLTIGGLRYVMAGGDPGEVEKAKNALRSSLIGYALAILAPVLVSIVHGFVGAG